MESAISSNNSYTFFVKENSPPGTFVGWLNNGMSAHYTILSTTNTDTVGSTLSFELDPYSGVLSTIRELDHESSEPLYSFQVLQMSANGLNVVDVLVIVDDVNDNPPTFLKAKEVRGNTFYFEVWIREDAKLGSEIVRMEFEDPDSGRLFKKLDT